MRTTVDLPDDLHELVHQLAHQTRRTMSDVLAELIRRGLARESSPPPSVSRRGMPVVSVGRPITSEDVASLDEVE